MQHYCASVMRFLYLKVIYYNCTEYVHFFFVYLPIRFPNVCDNCTKLFHDSYINTVNPFLFFDWFKRFTTLSKYTGMVDLLLLISKIINL